MEDFIVIIGGVFLAVLMATIGRLQDPQFKCWFLRRTLKKNYIVVNFGDKNNRIFFQSVVNADDGVIIMGQRMWIIKGSRMWSVISKDGKLHKDGKQEYQIKESDMKYSPGTPNVFLNPDTLTPLDFFKQEVEVKPDEIGSTLLAWTNNQVNKGLNKFASMDIWIKAGVALSVLIIVGLFILNGANDLTKKQMDANTAAIAELDRKLGVIGGYLHIDLSPPPPTNSTKTTNTSGQLIVNGKGGG